MGIRDNSRCANSCPPVRRALRAQSSPYASPRKRHRQPLPIPPDHRRQWPNRKNQSARVYVIRLSAPRRQADFQAVLFHQEKGQPAGSTPRAQAPPTVAWFRDHWQMIPRRSTDKERDCAPENRAIHKSAATTEYPTPEFPETPADTMPANRPAYRSVGDRDAPTADPTASGKSN